MIILVVHRWFLFVIMVLVDRWFVCVITGAVDMSYVFVITFVVNRWFFYDDIGGAQVVFVCDHGGGERWFVCSEVITEAVVPLQLPRRRRPADDTQ